jgi:hypothetical protein
MARAGGRAVSVRVMAGSGKQDTDDADRYFVPPYVGGRAWVGIRLDGPGVDRDRVEQVLHDAYRTVASQTLLRLLDPP